MNINFYMKLVEREDEFYELSKIHSEIFDDELEFEEEDLIFLAYTENDIIGFTQFSERKKCFEMKKMGVKREVMISGIENMILDESINLLYGKPIKVNVDLVDSNLNFYSKSGFFIDEFKGEYTLTKKEVN